MDRWGEVLLFYVGGMAGKEWFVTCFRDFRAGQYERRVLSNRSPVSKKLPNNEKCLAGRLA